MCSDLLTGPPVSVLTPLHPTTFSSPPALQGSFKTHINQVLLLLRTLQWLPSHSDRKSMSWQWATCPFRAYSLCSSFPPQTSPPSTLPLSLSTPATRPPCCSWDISRCTSLGPFPCFPLPRKQVPQTPKQLMSLPSIFKLWNECHRLLRKESNWTSPHEAPQAYPPRTSSPPSTPRLLVPTRAPSEGVAFFHASLLFP